MIVYYKSLAYLSLIKLINLILIRKIKFDWLLNFSFVKSTEIEISKLISTLNFLELICKLKLGIVVIGFKKLKSFKN